MASSAYMIWVNETNGCSLTANTLYIMFCESCSWLDMMLLQVLVSSAGSEAAAAPGSGLQGAGDLAGVSGRGSAELHQPGLSQLRAHQPEPQRPRTIQLWGRSGGLSCFLQLFLGILCQHTCTCTHRCNQFKIESDLVVRKRMPPPYTSLYLNDMVNKLCFLNKKVLSLSSDGFTLHSIPVYNTHRTTQPFHPTRVTQMTRKREKRRRMTRVCLCQGLMRRVMPWIGCWVGSPRFPLV